mmetsp:Transcript_14543/g.33925  ORF Transcript_14543/g.33925 Transcript_14543/m.33925 type:complete len:212 (+) Transcript_14543:971-1606(+)
MLAGLAFMPLGGCGACIWFIESALPALSSSRRPPLASCSTFSSVLRSMARSSNKRSIRCLKSACSPRLALNDSHCRTRIEEPGRRKPLRSSDTVLSKSMRCSTMSSNCAYESRVDLNLASSFSLHCCISLRKSRSPSFLSTRRACRYAACSSAVPTPCWRKMKSFARVTSFLSVTRWPLSKSSVEPVLRASFLAALSMVILDESVRMSRKV